MGVHNHLESANTLQRVPYRFTSKEFDEETGLYYFGARYYDPRTSVWQSADPIIGSYLDGKLNGGVFNSSNLALFTYVGNNPLIYIDPNGKHALRHHEKITRDTFGSGSNQLSQSAINRLVQGNLATDTCQTCQGSGASDALL